MKKIITILLISALGSALLLAGCGNKNTGTDQPEVPDASAASEPESNPGGMILGGRTASADAASTLTDEEKETLEKALEGLVGATYEPVVVLATQLVACTNYAYLCTTTPVVPDAVPHWTVAVVYKDLQGNVSLTNVADLDLADVKIPEQTDTSEAVGAWAITEPSGKAVMLPSEEAQAAFDKATEAYVGVSFQPIALLGTQIVAGTNYKILCYGTPSTSDPFTSLYVIDVYADLQGNAEITNADQLDLLAYVTPPIE